MQLKTILIKFSLFLIVLIAIVIVILVGNNISEKIFDARKYPTNEEIIFSNKIAPRNHHARALEDRAGKKRNKETLYYTSYLPTGVNKNSEKLNAVIFQGDSWMELIDTFASPPDTFFNNGVDILINGGTSSFSPSAMEIQFNDIRKDKNIQVDTVVAWIDQTDVMDEACRYNKLRIEDDNGKLVALLKANGPDLYNDTILSFSSIARSYDSALFGLFINQIQQKLIIPKLLSSYSDSFCKWTDISKFMEGRASNEDILIFQKNLNSLIENYSRNAKKVIFVTHKHRRHVENVYSLDVSSLVEKASKKYKNIYHYELTDSVPEYRKLRVDEIYPSYSEDPASHPHPTIFTNHLGPWIYNKVIQLMNNSRL